MIERPLSPGEAEEVLSYAESGLRLIGGTATAEPAAIVADIDAFVDAWPRREAGLVAEELARTDDIINLSWALGALWGVQLVRQFQWVWTVGGAGDAERYGVASGDRALALFPSYFVRERLYDAERDFTAMLSFNMLSASRFDSTAPASFLDLAETVMRIVPRR